MKDEQNHRGASLLKSRCIMEIIVARATGLHQMYLYFLNLKLGKPQKKSFFRGTAEALQNELFRTFF